MTLEIKICGLSTPESVAVALDAGADMIGLVFFPKSPRHLDFDTARNLAALIRGRAEIVALTVDADDALLDRIVDAVQPTLLQCHGSETPARLDSMRARYGLPVMKALKIRDQADVATIATYIGHADRLLLDAAPPSGSDRPGGNGEVFDWTLLAGLDIAIPLMLSGGLTPDNVAEASRLTNITGLDVSTGVERERGVKDHEKIRAFISAARAAALS